MGKQKNYCINLYQNACGEICAFVEYDGGNENHCCKLVENIERFAKTSGLMLDYLLDGFSGFPDYDPREYNEKEALTVLEEMTEEDDYKMILHLESDGITADYYFENMNDFAVSEFQSIKKITDKKAVEYGQRLK